jgi:hypothetical protein
MPFDTAIRVVLDHLETKGCQIQPDYKDCDIQPADVMEVVTPGECVFLLKCSLSQELRFKVTDVTNHSWNPCADIELAEPLSIQRLETLLGLSESGPLDLPEISFLEEPKSIRRRRPSWWRCGFCV